MPIINRVAEMLPEIASWRQDIHAHPEIMFEVHRTAGVVAEKLKAFGCDQVATGIGRTGVVGVIKGNCPGSTRTGMPLCASAYAAASPPMPPPAIRIGRSRPLPEVIFLFFRTLSRSVCVFVW